MEFSFVNKEPKYLKVFTFSSELLPSYDHLPSFGLEVHIAKLNTWEPTLIQNLNIIIGSNSYKR